MREIKTLMEAGFFHWIKQDDQTIFYYTVVIFKYLILISIPMIEFSEIQKRIAKRISIEELEVRLRPQEPEMREGKWSDFSSGGFLAPDESLMAMIRADYDTLCSLGKTYEEMAQLAANILEQTLKESYVGGNMLTKGVKSFLARHWKPIVNIDREKFELWRIESGGIQSCHHNVIIALSSPIVNDINNWTLHVIDYLVGD